MLIHINSTSCPFIYVYTMLILLIYAESYLIFKAQLVMARAGTSGSSLRGPEDHEETRSSARVFSVYLPNFSAAKPRFWRDNDASKCLDQNPRLWWSRHQRRRVRIDSLAIFKAIHCPSARKKRDHGFGALATISRTRPNDDGSVELVSSRTDPSPLRLSQSVSRMPWNTFFLFTISARP